MSEQTHNFFLTSTGIKFWPNPCEGTVFEFETIKPKWWQFWKSHSIGLFVYQEGQPTLCNFPSSFIAKVTVRS